MSQIVTEVYDAFRAANVDENLARAAAGAIADREELVTKLDLERAVGQVKADLTAEIGRVETGLKDRIGHVETGLNDRIGRVEAGLNDRIGRVEADLKLLKIGYGPAILGLLIKLVFFP